MNKFLLFLGFVLCTSSLQAVTYIYFQNNSSLQFSVSRVQYGTHIMSAGEWGFSGDTIRPWQLNTEVMWTNRNQGVHNGDDFFFDVKLKNGNDSVTLKVKLHGNFVGSDLWQAASGPGFSHPWYGDNNFHSASFTMGGKQFTLKYTAYFTGGDDDILYALQEENPWPLSASDTSNPNIFNVLAYNIYMLTPPAAFTDQADRAAEIWKHIHGYDAIIFSEAFYNSARDNDLIPSISAEYPYHTPVVDAGTFNDDGGVFIASRWPIDTFAFIVFDDCNGTDCLAAKGVMYAKINKSGKPYHLFGSHTQAWNDSGDVAVRVLQFQQMLRFIDSLHIPDAEPVIIGGDLNVDKILNNLNEYYRMLDSLDVLAPQYLGNPYTYDGNLSYYTSSGEFEYLDYVFTQNQHFSPYSATNEVIILRSIANPLWDIFDLSDHFAVRGRFVFPEIMVQPQAQSLCEGDELQLYAQLSTTATYQWYLDGLPIISATADSLVLIATATDAGNYHCVMTYNNGAIASQAAAIQVQAAPIVPIISQVGNFLETTGNGTFQWYLNGQPIVGATDSVHLISGFLGDAYTVLLDSAGCSSLSDPFYPGFVGVQALENEEINIYPNPAQSHIYIDFSEQFTQLPIHLSIVDMTGRVVAGFPSAWGTDIHQMDVRNLPSGMYCLWVEFMDKNPIQRKFSIQR